MSSDFTRLRNERGSGAALLRLQGQLRYDLGMHKATRLRVAGRSGSATLLHNEVAREHGALLLHDYEAHCGTQFDRNRLRFMTVLHEVTPCDVAGVLESVTDMQDRMREVLQGGGFWGLGAAEVELVSVDFLRRFESQGDDNKRKLQTVLSLGDGVPSGTLAFVHCHVLIDLGDGHQLVSEAALREALSRVDVWSRVPYQIEVKSTFRSRSLAQNLKGIADYLTKGGNEQLRYKAGYGRDLAEDLDAKIWRAGLGRKDQGADPVEDERGLTVGEVAFLDEVYKEMMRSRPDGRGYLISSKHC